MKNLILLALLFLSASACTTQLVKMDVASVDPSLKARIAPSPSAERVTGSDCMVLAFVIPLDSVPTAEEAFDNALAKTKGAKTLVDSEIILKQWAFGFYSKICYEVTGTPVYPVALSRAAKEN
jgi:hypothetical protein